MKGITALENTPAFFTSAQAMINLGVGKNMVRSIRHWCLAARIIEETRSNGRAGLRSTEFGRRIFLDPGYDPYLEDPATLWLIHWQIASNMKTAAMWFWVFSFWNIVEFNKQALVTEVESWIAKEGHKPISANSLKRDADCFVRTYVHSKRNKDKDAVSEDTLDCPLIDLNLIDELVDGKTYRFLRGPQSSLPDEVLAFALIEFWNAQGTTANNLAFEKIAYEPGSPGKIFKIDEDSLVNRLEKIEIVSEGALYYDDTAGIKQIYKRTVGEIDPFVFLDSYYNNHA
jgi:hypothetical protein